MELNITVEVIKKRNRKLIFFPAKNAAEYFEYCGELGCENVEKNWSVMENISGALGEPGGYWLPIDMRGDSSEYVQGVEVPKDFDGELPDGAYVIELPSDTVLQFTGEPYDDSDFENAVSAMIRAINAFNPVDIGYEWDYSVPRCQLAPLGSRGYIESRGVVKKDLDNMSDSDYDDVS